MARSLVEPAWWEEARRLYRHETRNLPEVKRGMYARIARAVGKSTKAVRYALLPEVRKRNVRNAARRRYSRPGARRFDAMRRKLFYVYGRKEHWPTEAVEMLESYR